METLRIFEVTAVRFMSSHSRVMFQCYAIDVYWLWIRANCSDDGQNMESIYRCCEHSASTTKTLRLDSSPGQTKRCLLCISQRRPQKDAFLDDSQMFQPVTNLRSTYQKFWTTLCFSQKGPPWPGFPKLSARQIVGEVSLAIESLEATSNMMQPVASYGLSIAEYIWCTNCQANFRQTLGSSSVQF